jgi:hypothetical protein
MAFLYDFGFVPSTVAEDGDPVDVLIMMDEPAFVGCLVECRMVGTIGREQGKKKKKLRSDRIVHRGGELQFRGNSTCGRSGKEISLGIRAVFRELPFAGRGSIPDSWREGTKRGSVPNDIEVVREEVRG